MGTALLSGMRERVVVTVLVMGVERLRAEFKRAQQRLTVAARQHFAKLGLVFQQYAGNAISALGGSEAMAQIDHALLWLLHTNTVFAIFWA
ncbi:hypothetical protein [Pseudomonas asiatica]|uniref:hypothetical protein n=1 Tax=Pseudomonas asiatica TaxID=2219225 RepID=UPI001E43E431|nr:hypothetical protein [Pseudomonas asiatica]MCE0944425.1 hypothetical protein [Pseudomonas asiatica]MCE1031995.1 hypothetical protein [Pseudomonas asiatica]MCE1066217.1 hypothetical protein [Pseudomonas asiatica]